MPQATEKINDQQKKKATWEGGVNLLKRGDLRKRNKPRGETKGDG